MFRIVIVLAMVAGRAASAEESEVRLDADTPEGEARSAKLLDPKPGVSSISPDHSAFHKYCGRTLLISGGGVVGSVLLGLLMIGGGGGGAAMGLLVLPLLGASALTFVTTGLIWAVGSIGLAVDDASHRRRGMATAGPSMIRDVTPRPPALSPRLSLASMPAPLNQVVAFSIPL